MGLIQNSNKFRNWIIFHPVEFKIHASKDLVEQIFLIKILIRLAIGIQLAFLD